MSAEARERIAAWVKEIQAASADKRAADALADRQSLDRAADLEAIYTDMAWVDEMPPPKRKKLGRRIDPKSREQFAKWVKQTYAWGTSLDTVRRRLGHLHQAHELLPILGTAVPGIRPTGEWVLRPLAKLRADGYGGNQTEVWQTAIKIAEGDAPTAGHVRKAVAEFLERHQPPVKNLAADPRTPAEKRADRLARWLAEFDAILAEEPKTAHTGLTTATQHYNAYRVALREEKTA
jgi:hypothetical protein